uniref:Cop9 signalosome subunit 5 C-terminal domain-containing protein n=1 Tax=Ananas comosus var. bracteatus TaxID=296719 RepID=A0A6V7P510_ANACO|nr:unnamed protein product [Ananas comosus var. bracteatus]
MIDSMRTVSTGKVEIGAFKIFGPVFNNKISPLDRFEECSIFRKHDYALDITYFMSSLDSHLLNLLRNKYWVNSFSSSSLLANWDYAAELVFDLAEKLEEAEDQMDHTFLESSHLEKEVRCGELWYLPLSVVKFSNIEEMTIQWMVGLKCRMEDQSLIDAWCIKVSGSGPQGLPLSRPAPVRQLLQVRPHRVSLQRHEPLGVYRAMRARSSYLSAFVPLSNDFFARQNRRRNAILVDVIPPSNLGHFPQDSIANGLASRFGGYPSDFHVARYRERDYVVFLSEWVPCEQLLRRETLTRGNPASLLSLGPLPRADDFTVRMVDLSGTGASWPSTISLTSSKTLKSASEMCQSPCSFNWNVGRALKMLEESSHATNVLTRMILTCRSRPGGHQIPTTAAKGATEGGFRRLADRPTPTPLGIRRKSAIEGDPLPLHQPLPLLVAKDDVLPPQHVRTRVHDDSTKTHLKAADPSPPPRCPPSITRCLLAVDPSPARGVGFDLPLFFQIQTL